MTQESYEKRHAEIVRRLGAECTVLLRKDGRFPLAGPCPIALYGSGARRTVRGGTGSGEVNTRYAVSAEEGLKAAGFTVTTGAWLDAYDRAVEAADAAFVREIKARARAKHTLAILEGMGAVMPEPEYDIPLGDPGDTAVYVLSRVSGEGSDRNPVPGDILLTGAEVRDILRLNAACRDFMLVLNTGGPVDLTPVAEVRNILVLSQLGAETGHILADILLGKSAPSGRLATTWAAWEDNPAVGDFGETDDTRYREGVFVGYRYYEAAGRKPLFPFGFGLSYTEFEAECVRADAGSVTVAVRNAGKYPGKETVQVWIAPPAGAIPKPVRALAAFAKTPELQPGASCEMTVPFDLRDAASYDEARAAFILEKGDYTVLAGDVPAVTLRLPADAVTRQVRNLLDKPDFEDWRPEARREIPPAETVLDLDPADFAAETVAYGFHPPVPPEVKALPDEELARLNIGAFDPKGGVASMIGSAGRSVAGAAGETARVGDLPYMVMADGPAGLRISRDYTRDAKGVHPLGSPLPESMLRFTGGLTGLAMRLLTRPRKARGEVLHQYCTAIPVGSAIAQSWNTELAERLGDLVGDEMERFGVHLWLAPALNIHRSIRCGRNFEYFSEDPLISGKFAAAITRGVQRHPGCGATVKHFAANNQETNRTGSNSMVSERAMREIYLRGFEICVREGRPHALMTSYNLLNGTHTSERRGLCVDILRCEWGYEGVVMTDWVVGVGKPAGRYRNALADRVAAAGGALFMPGSRGDLRRVLDALRDGRLTRAQLEENAGTVIRMAEKLAGRRDTAEE